MKLMRGRYYHVNYGDEEKCQFTLLPPIWWLGPGMLQAAAQAARESCPSRTVQGPFYGRHLCGSRASQGRIKGEISTWMISLKLRNWNVNQQGVNLNKPDKFSFFVIHQVSCS